MRNLLEYPLTKQELLLWLGTEQCAHNPETTGLCGDMTPVYLSAITDIVMAAFEMCDGFERRGKEPGMGFVVPFPEAAALIKACRLG